MTRFNNYVLKLSVLLSFCVSISAHAIESFNVQDLRSVLNGVANIDGCEVRKVVFAKGNGLPRGH